MNITNMQPVRKRENNLQLGRVLGCEMHFCLCGPIVLALHTVEKEGGKVLTVAV